MSFCTCCCNDWQRQILAFDDPGSTFDNMFGRKNPFVTHEGRVHMISMTVKSGVYSSIAVAWFLGLMGTLGQQELHDWRPFALTAFLGITAFLSFIEVGKPKHNPDAAAPAPSNGVAS